MQCCRQHATLHSWLAARGTWPARALYLHHALAYTAGLSAHTVLPILVKLSVTTVWCLTSLSARLIARTPRNDAQTRRTRIASVARPCSSQARAVASGARARSTSRGWAPTSWPRTWCLQRWRRPVAWRRRRAARLAHFATGSPRPSRSRSGATAGGCRWPRDRDCLPNLAPAPRPAHRSVTAVVCDVTKPEEVQGVVDFTGAAASLAASCPRGRQPSDREARAAMRL